MEREERVSKQVTFVMSFEEFIALMTPFGLTKAPIHIIVNHYSRQIEFQMAIEAVPK